MIAAVKERAADALGQIDNQGTGFGKGPLARF